MENKQLNAKDLLMNKKKRRINLESNRQCY